MLPTPGNDTREYLELSMSHCRSVYVGEASGIPLKLDDHVFQLAYNYILTSVRSLQLVCYKSSSSAHLPYSASVLMISVGKCVLAYD